MPPNQLLFTYNWNGKLFGSAFTTLRLWNERKYRINDTFRVFLKGEEVGTAQLIGMRRTHLEDLNEFVARLDTGYSLAKAKSVISSMYGMNKNHELGLYLFAWTKKEDSINVKAITTKLARVEKELAKLQNAKP